MKNNRQEPPDQESNSNTQPKGADSQPKRVVRRDGSGLRAVIKALDGIGAIGLGGAGVLAVTSHKSLAILCLFVALSAFPLAVFLTTYPALKRGQKVKRRNAIRLLWTTELVILAACAALWLIFIKPKQQSVVATKTAGSPSPTPAMPVSLANASPSPVTALTPNGREFLDIDPEKLLGFFEQYNEAQAQSLVDPYIGKWLEMPGRVTEVSRELLPLTMQESPDLKYGIKVLLRTGRRDKSNSDNIVTLANFYDPRWINRAMVLKRNEDIKVRGQIRFVLKHGFSLEHCEIIE